MGCVGSTPTKVDDGSKNPSPAGQGSSGDGGNSKLDYKSIHSACRWNTASIKEIEEILTSQPGALVCEDTTNGNTPLHIASQNGHKAIVELICKLGNKSEAVLNAKNQSGNTPLHMSVEYDYYDTAVVLKENGADVNAQNAKGYQAKKGIEGLKHILFMPLLNNKSIETVKDVLSECDSNTKDLDKSTFAAFGLRTKKALGPGVWTDEVQEMFKGVLLKI